MRDGYVIINNLISKETCQQIKQEGLALLGQTGRNPFEGQQTQRVYNVLSKTRITDQLAVHPHILGLMDRLFQPNFLLSQSQIINILSGEVAQSLHYDDAFYRLPRPRQPLGAATVWAIDDFTEDNGATVIIPGSHRWGDDRFAQRSEAIPAVMPAGSVIFFSVRLGMVAVKIIRNPHALRLLISTVKPMSDNKKTICLNFPKIRYGRFHLNFKPWLVTQFTHHLWEWLRACTHCAH